MTVVSVFPHEVDSMTVFIPKGTFVGQGAVGDSDIIVVVIGRERSTLVVSHGIT